MTAKQRKQMRTIILVIFAICMAGTWVGCVKTPIGQTCIETCTNYKYSQNSCTTDCYNY